MMCAVMGENRRIIRVPQDQGELDATTPVLGDLAWFEAVLQVYRALVHIVTKWEEQYSPRRQRQPEVSPRMYMHIYQGKPPAWKMGPCSFLPCARQFSIFQVKTVSESTFGSSIKGCRTISLMVSSEECQHSFQRDRLVGNIQSSALGRSCGCSVSVSKLSGLMMVRLSFSRPFSVGSTICSSVSTSMSLGDGISGLKASSQTAKSAKSSASRWWISSKLRDVEVREDWEGNCSESGGDGEGLGPRSNAVVDGVGLGERSESQSLSWSGGLL